MNLQGSTTQHYHEGAKDKAYVTYVGVIWPERNKEHGWEELLYDMTSLGDLFTGCKQFQH